MKGCDNWLWNQVERDYSARYGNEYDCLDEGDEECGECEGCKARAKEDYEDTKAEHDYELMKEHEWDFEHAHELINGGRHGL